VLQRLQHELGRNTTVIEVQKSLVTHTARYQFEPAVFLYALEKMDFLKQIENIIMQHIVSLVQHHCILIVLFHFFFFCASPSNTIM
jgi:hypothetical protein